MKLIGADASPFVQRVKIVARLKGLDLPLAALPEGGLKGDAVMGLNPMARMPILIADDGWALAESANIAMYLEETADGPSILPTDPRGRARVRWFVQLVDGPFDAGMRTISRTAITPGSLSPLAQQESEDLAKLGVEELNEGLAAIAAVAKDSGQWLVGDAPTLADAALFPVLAMLDVMRPWNKVHDRIVLPSSLAAYRDGLMSDPLFGSAAAEMKQSFEHVAGLWKLTPA